MGDIVRQVSSFFGLNEDGGGSISARSVGVQRQELPKTVAASGKHEDEPSSSESSLLAKAKAETRCLKVMLADADDALAASTSEMEQIEQGWTEKVNGFMQKNGQLRVDLKAAQRARALAEGELDAARKRMAELEQALTDAALGGGEDDDLPSSRPAAASASVATIASLGDGHGAIDLVGTAGSQQDAKPRGGGLVLDASSWTRTR